MAWERAKGEPFTQVPKHMQETQMKLLDLDFNLA